MRGVNKVILMGHLGRDPEVRYTPGGTAVARLSLATSDAWRDKATGEPQEQTEWHRVVFYGKLAETAGTFLRKGSKVFVEGALHTRKWQEKDTGRDRYTTEVKGLALELVDSRGELPVTAGNDPLFAPEEAAEGGRTPPRRGMPLRRGAGAAAQAFDFDDDIPF